jgi:Phosphotransferase enzyme family
MARRVVRIGDTVRRPLGPWSAAVHGLLRHLEAAAFPAPRVVGAQGDCEVLSWIEGESGVNGWARIVPEAGLRRWGGLLRRYHDAVRGYRPAPGTEWASGLGTCGPGEIICHGDFGPWNAVWQGDEIAGLIDWDMAGPAAPIFDIAYALDYAVPFRDDEESMRWMRHQEPPDRRHRIETFCTAYGMPVPDDIVARVADQQRVTAENCAALARRGVEPQATWARDGYLEQLQARISWTEAAQIW